MTTLLRECGCFLNCAIDSREWTLLVGRATTMVEIDSDLLVRLRERSPGKSDRELLEELATVTLGFEARRRAGALPAFPEGSSSCAADWHRAGEQHIDFSASSDEFPK
jgi:hypothetical protein